jgi:hypothetical protein
MRAFDTIAPRVDEQPYQGGAAYPLQGRTLAVFVLTTHPRRRASDEAAVPPARTSQS